MTHESGPTPSPGSNECPQNEMPRSIEYQGIDGSVQVMTAKEVELIEATGSSGTWQDYALTPSVYPDREPLSETRGVGSWMSGQGYSARKAEIRRIKRLKAKLRSAPAVMKTGPAPVQVVMKADLIPVRGARPGVDADGYVIPAVYGPNERPPKDSPEVMHGRSAGARTPSYKGE